MGLAYTIDTPLRVASKGIDSVVSIVDDDLAEKMRVFFCKKYDLPYTSISTKSLDHRAKRKTEYLNFLDRLVKQKFQNFMNETLFCNTTFFLDQKDTILKILGRYKSTVEAIKIPVI